MISTSCLEKPGKERPDSPQFQQTRRLLIFNRGTCHLKLSHAWGAVHTTANGHLTTQTSPSAKYVSALSEEGSLFSLSSLLWSILNVV